MTPQIGFLQCAPQVLQVVAADRDQDAAGTRVDVLGYDLRLMIEIELLEAGLVVAASCVD